MTPAPVRDSECVDFLQWALPRLGMRWAGFRKVRRQVCRRVERRLRELGLPDARAYRSRLEARPDEWPLLDAACRITISRFYRDRGVFDGLRDSVLPELAGTASERGDAALRCWIAGCASGEEAYTLAAVWQLGVRLRFPQLRLDILATDADAALLGRARRGRFGASSLEDFPEAWREAAFDRLGRSWCVRRELREGIAFVQGDVRGALPDGPFELILCRNLAFTYFAEPLQRRTAARLAARLVPGGALVIGAREALPEGAECWVPWNAAPGIYRRTL